MQFKLVIYMYIQICNPKSITSAKKGLFYLDVTLKKLKAMLGY